MGKKEKREEYLLRFSVAFAQNGLNRTPVKKLSEAAGINEASIYQYFSNKDEIVVECVKRFFSNMQNELFPVMMDPQISLDQRLKRMLLYHAQMEQQEKFVIQVLTDPEYQKKCVPILRSHMAIVRETLSRISTETGVPESALYPMGLITISLLMSHCVFNSTDAMLVQMDYIRELFAEELKKESSGCLPTI